MVHALSLSSRKHAIEASVQQYNEGQWGFFFPQLPATPTTARKPPSRKLTHSHFCAVLVA